MDRIPECSGRWSAYGQSCGRGWPGAFNRPAPTEDRLLVTADAASRLGVSKDWLRRGPRVFPGRGAASGDSAGIRLTRRFFEPHLGGEQKPPEGRRVYPPGTDAQQATEDRHRDLESGGPLHVGSRAVGREREPG